MNSMRTSLNRRRDSNVRCAAALVILVEAMSVGTALARPLDEVLAAKTLRVVVYQDNRPFSYLDGGDVKGIDVDIGRAIAKKIGVDAEIISRMTAEKVDDDLRFNIWKGPVGDGGVGDVMLHVPVDRELAGRNNLAVIANGYFQEQVALAIDPERTGPAPDFEVFRKEKIGVQFSTVADYFLMRYGNGALMNNIVHHTKLEAGVRQFVDKETSAILGVRSDIEGTLHGMGVKATFTEPVMPGIVRTNWVIGTAVKDNSRDLGYAVGAALDVLKASGEMAAIFASYGVTYVAPPVE
jgi:polar amino acid transport system substrate-binding protein